MKMVYNAAYFCMVLLQQTIQLHAMHQTGAGVARGALTALAEETAARFKVGEHSAGVHTAVHPVDAHAAMMRSLAAKHTATAMHQAPTPLVPHSTILAASHAAQEAAVEQKIAALEAAQKAAEEAAAHQKEAAPAKATSGGGFLRRSTISQQPTFKSVAHGVVSEPTASAAAAGVPFAFPTGETALLDKMMADLAASTHTASSVLATPHAAGSATAATKGSAASTVSAEYEQMAEELLADLAASKPAVAAPASAIPAGAARKTPFVVDSVAQQAKQAVRAAGRQQAVSTQELPMDLEELFMELSVPTPGAKGQHGSGGSPGSTVAAHGDALARLQALQTTADAASSSLDLTGFVTQLQQAEEKEAAGKASSKGGASVDNTIRAPAAKITPAISLEQKMKKLVQLQWATNGKLNIAELFDASLGRSNIKKKKKPSRHGGADNDDSIGLINKMQLVAMVVAYEMMESGITEVTMEVLNPWIIKYNLYVRLELHKPKNMEYFLRCVKIALFMDIEFRDARNSAAARQKQPVGIVISAQEGDSHASQEVA